MKAKALGGRRQGTVASVVALSVAGLVLLAGVSTAGAQFLCPDSAGDAQGIEIAVGTVVVAVTGEQCGPPGGTAPMSASMTGGDGRVASVFFDVCFDEETLDVSQELRPQGPCRDQEPQCPGGQVCEQGVCMANEVLTCTLDSRLQAQHYLVATSPIDPEHPTPRRLRLGIGDATREAQVCVGSEECQAGEVCLPVNLSRCVSTCDSDDDCSPPAVCTAAGDQKVCYWRDAPKCTSVEECQTGEVCLALNRCVRTCTVDADCDGARCRAVGDQMVCSSLNIISDGPLVRCTFDVLTTATPAETSLDFGLLEVADDGVPAAMPLPAEGVPGAISVEPCPDCPCPPEKVCVDGVCLTPPATPTPTGGTLTPTPTGGTLTPTPTGGTLTPTPTGGTLTPTPTGGTLTPTPTTPPTGVTQTPTITDTPTPEGAGRGDHDGCHCEIVPTERRHPLNSFVVLVAPLLLLWGRRRRY